MPTIVKYADWRPPTNRYPHQIISPPRAGGCCFSDMGEVGTPQQDGHWVYQCRRCRRCGFAARVILREIPDTTLVNSLRKELAHSFVRNIPDQTRGAVQGPMEWGKNPGRFGKRGTMVEETTCYTYQRYTITTFQEEGEWWARARVAVKQAGGDRSVLGGPWKSKPEAKTAAEAFCDSRQAG